MNTPRGRHRVAPTATAGTRLSARVLAGGVALAGMSGAVVANAAGVDHSADVDSPSRKVSPVSEAQIIQVAKVQQFTDLSEQLTSALDFHSRAIAEDLLNRTPQTVKPTDGTYTSGYEIRWGTMHKGIDLAAPLGTPILAAQSGTIIDAGPASGFGNWVRIKHDDGTITVYGHMQTIDVTVGQQVSAGQKIAGVGNLGFSTGPHCHFEVYPDGVNSVDPQGWLADRGVEL